MATCGHLRNPASASLPPGTCPEPRVETGQPSCARQPQAEFRSQDPGSVTPVNTSTAAEGQPQLPQLWVSL